MIISVLHSDHSPTEFSQPELERIRKPSISRLTLLRTLLLSYKPDSLSII